MKMNEEARWQIVDIPITQWQLTTLKKEDQRTQEGVPRVPKTVRSKALFKSTDTKATNHWKNGKNNS
jgi:hypothetical protein